METTSKVDNEILNTLQWTEDSYSLKDFVDVFSLPQVVKVIRGYDGGEHSATIRYGQVLALHAIRDSSIFQAEDTEIKSLLKPSPCDTVIATTVCSDQNLKLCFEIPKDLDIKFVVADGFDNGAKHYTDIVNELNDRFDVVKFMNTYKTMLIRRQDQIQKFDYDVIKEYIIDKSIFLSKPDDEEGLDMVDRPTFPPQRVENLFQATKGNYDTTDLYEKSPSFIMRTSNFEKKIPSSDSVYQISSSLLSILADADYPYKLICNVPLDLSDMSVNEVADVIRNLNMGQYANIFEDELIDGRLLNELTDSDLESFNMTALHRTKLMKFVKGWRPVFLNQNDLSNEQDETFNPVIPSSDKETFSVESVESSDEEEIYEDENLKEKDTTMDKFVSSKNDLSFYSSFPSNPAIRNDENIEEKSDIDEAISTPNSSNEEVFDEVDGFQRKLKDISRRKKKSFDIQPSTDMNIFKKSVLAGSSVDGIYHQNTLKEKPKRSKIGNHKLAATKEKSKDSIYENVSNILPSTTVHPISSSFFAFQHNSSTDPFMDISKSLPENAEKDTSVSKNFDKDNHLDSSKDSEKSSASTMKTLSAKNEVASFDSSSGDRALIPSEEDPHNVPMLPLVVPNRPIAEHSYKFIGNVPQDLSALSVVAVGDILRGLKMGQYANTFEMELIDGIMLMKLTDSDLKSFNMSSNQRLKLMRFIKGWRPQLKLTERGKTRNPVMSSSDKEVFLFENEQPSDKENIADGERLEEMDIRQEADIFEEEIIDGVLVKSHQTTSLRTKATRPVLMNRNDSLYEQEFNLKSQFLDENYNIKKDVHEKFRSLSWICGNYGTVTKNKVVSYPHLYITVDGVEERSDEDLKNQVDQAFEWEASKFIEIRRKPYKKPKIRCLSNLPDVNKYVMDFGEKNFVFNSNQANGELYQRIEIREETVKVRINNHIMGFIIERCFSHLTKYTNVDKEETEREVIFQNAVKVKSDCQFLENGDSGGLVYFLDKQENWQPFAYVLCEIEDDYDGDEKEDNDLMKCKNRVLKTFICLKLDES